MTKQCPLCKNHFEGEEFCPVDFVPLQSVAAPSNETSTDAEPPLQSTALPEQLAQPINAEEAESEGLLSRLSKKLGNTFKRKVSGNPSASEQCTDAVLQSLDLPSELREKGWVVNGQPASLHGIDVWPVQRRGTADEAVPGQLVVYASGVLTDVPTYNRLLQLGTSPARAHLHAFGSIDRGHRVRASYELITVPGAWQSLNNWLIDSPPSEERALSLLPGLCALLADWCDSGVFPISLDPSVIQRNAAGQLRLVRFGALCNAAPDGTTAVYRPELAHAGSLLAAPWAAPEVKGRLVVAPQSAVFSVAQLIAMALFGQPHSLNDVQSGLLPFSGIQSAELARLLMGGLWPHADGRWTLTDMRQALEASTVAQMPAAPTWSRLMPGAADTAFDLGGESHYRLEDALIQANQPRHWNEAVQRMDALLLWASATAWKGLAQGLQTELNTGTRTADWVLVQLTRQVCPDLPLTWRGLDFSDTHAQASLHALAQQALTSASPDFTQLRLLFQSDLRGAFTVPG